MNYKTGYQSYCRNDQVGVLLLNNCVYNFLLSRCCLFFSLCLGDKFNFSVHRTWEFNETNPIRSIVIPYVITGPAFSILHYLGMQENSNALLVVPRVFMTLLSFLTDVLLYHTAKALTFDADAVVLTYCTSYVTFVHHTRTLSNSVESLLFVALLCLVVVCCKQRKVIQAELNPRSKLTKAQRLKEMPDIEKEWRYALGIAFVLVTGLFNRPTFILFAFVPCVYWITNGQLTFWKNEIAILCVFRRILCLGIFAIPMNWVFIMLDSMYYHDFDFAFKEGFVSTIFNFVVITPLNFIWYNTDVDNLAEHTLHPHYLHFAVNAQMLFGFLGICAFVSFLKTMGHLKYLVPNHEYTWKIFLLYSYMVPVILLSVFPHQEPRFLIPVLCPLVLLFGHYLFGIAASEFWQGLWLLFNFFAAQFFGIFHQGGMINAINTVKFHHSNHVADQLHPVEHHVIFYNTYMPPRHLFAIPESDEPQSLVIHDLQGQDPIEIVHLSMKIFKYSSNPRVLFLAPRTVEHKFCANKDVKALGRFSFKLLYQFAPHVTMEDPPSWAEIKLAMADWLPCSTCPGSSCDKGLSRSMGGLFALNLYHVTYN